MTQIDLNLTIRLANEALVNAQRELEEARKLKQQILSESRRARTGSRDRDDQVFVELEAKIPTATRQTETKITPGRVDATLWRFVGSDIERIPGTRGKITAPQGVYNTSTEREISDVDNEGRKLIRTAHRDFHSGRLTVTECDDSSEDISLTGCQCVDRYNVCAVSIDFRGVDQPEASGLLQVIGPNNPPTVQGLCQDCADWNVPWRVYRIESTTTACKFAVGQVGGGWTTEPTAPALACFPCLQVGANAGLVVNVSCNNKCEIVVSADLYMPGQNNEACIVQQWFWDAFDPTLEKTKAADRLGEFPPPTSTTSPCYRPAGSCSDVNDTYPTCSSTLTWSLGATYAVNDLVKDTQTPSNYHVVTGGTGPTSGDDTDLPGGSDPGYTYTRVPSHWNGWFDIVNCLHRGFDPLAQPFLRMPLVRLHPCGSKLPVNDAACPTCNVVGFQATSPEFSATNARAVAVDPYPLANDDHVWQMTGVNPDLFGEVQFLNFNRIRPVTNNVNCDYDILLRYENQGAPLQELPGVVTITWDAGTGKPVETFQLDIATGGLDGAHNTDTFNNWLYRNVGTITHDGMTDFDIKIRGPAGGTGDILIFDDIVFRRKG